jgi:hypothetical protein
MTDFKGEEFGESPRRTPALVAQRGPSPYSEIHGVRAPLERFAISDATFDEALRALAAKARPNAVVGFEPAVVATGTTVVRVTGVCGGVERRDWHVDVYDETWRKPPAESLWPAANQSE